jgi:hypothetical protein
MATATSRAGSRKWTVRKALSVLCDHPTIPTILLDRRAERWRVAWKRGSEVNGGIHRYTQCHIQLTWKEWFQSDPYGAMAEQWYHGHDGEPARDFGRHNLSNGMTREKMPEWSWICFWKYVEKDNCLIHITSPGVHLLFDSEPLRSKLPGTLV